MKGQQFNCVEQYIMYSKAVLFNDNPIAGKIMRETDPINQKVLGKKIQDFNSKTWNANYPRLLKEALLAKFSQNVHCANFLIATEKKTYVKPTAMTVGMGWGSA